MLWLVRGKAPSAILGSRIPIELSTHSPQECGEWEGTGAVRVKNVGRGAQRGEGPKEKRTRKNKLRKDWAEQMFDAQQQELSLVMRLFVQ